MTTYSDDSASSTELCNYSPLLKGLNFCISFFQT